MTSTTHLKRLSALAVLAVASALVAFSGAWFASTDESEGSSVTTANVALQLFTSTERETPAPDDTAAGTVVLDATHLRPGAPARERTVELRNGGDVDIELAITKVGDGGPETAALLQALTLSVDDCGADATCASPDVRLRRVAEGRRHRLAPRLARTRREPLHPPAPDLAARERRPRSLRPRDRDRAALVGDDDVTC